MKTLEIRQIDNIDEAKKIWTELSPDKVLCDNWDFRYCFYKYFNYPLHFYIGLDNGEIVGLLPLQYNKDTECLEFFGGGFMSDNRVFIKQGYEEYIPQFYDFISLPSKMQSIVGEDIFTKSFEIYRYKYVRDLFEINNIEEYLIKHFKAKSRQGIRKKIKLIEYLEPEIINNNFSDLDLLIELNKKSFGENSSFHKPHRAEIFHDLLKLNFDIYMFSYVINGKKEAVSFSIKYKDAYIYINAGTNKTGVPNLGTFNIYKNLEKAIQLGMKTFDAGIGDLGWKERWHLEKNPQYIFNKMQQ